jgi:hypothetical protein
MRDARCQWRSCKKKSAALRQRFLQERADFFAKQLKCSGEKAVKAIIKSERSRQIYQNIQEIMGKQHIPLTQIGILSSDSASDGAYTSLTSKEEIEKNLLQ